MKRTYALTGLTLAVCALAAAQNAGQIVIPAGSKARVIDVASTNGSIVIKTSSGRDIVVESPHSERRDRNVPPGMHRLDVPSRGINVEEGESVVRIRDASPGGGEGIVLTVPVDSSLHLRSNNGSIRVDGVHGEIDAESNNGSMHILNVSGSVLASSHNSPVVVTMDRVEPAKPSAFSSFNGSVDVTLPADIKANLKMTTDNGSIYSDFDVTMGGRNLITTPSGRQGSRYQIRVDRTVLGTINGGGADLTFRTNNGSIVIRKKK
jgi:DUF4097 and DUF4098 domain-containing protein YvlB